MVNPLMAALDLWNRRYWREDHAALARIPQGAPAVVITGGSEGIGLALAHRLLADGLTLLLVARKDENLAAAKTALEARAKGDARVLTLALDVTVAQAPDLIADALRRHGLYADIVINNAGIGLGGEFVSHSQDVIDRLIELNVTALTRLTRHFLPDMCVRGRGGIINVSSLGGYGPGPLQAAYYASKAYVTSLTRAIAHETRGLGVRVVTLAPGPVETLFHSRMGAGTAFYRYFIPGQSPDAVARAAWRGYRWGQRIVLPGLVAPVLALAMKVSPAILVAPIIAILLRPRGGENARS